jgi:membrane protease subunit HflK
MAEDQKVSTEERVRRSVRRTVANVVLALLLLGALGAWGSLGFYTLKPGQAAVLLRLGRHTGTVTDQGAHWTLPPPLVERMVVNVNELKSETFGFRGNEGEAGGEKNREKLLEATMQTSDNNIVRLSFLVQYSIKDAFDASFRVEDVDGVLRDAAQAAMREVVGRMTIEGVLSEQKGEVKLEAERVLQDILDAYDSGLTIGNIQLQEVQPPAEVRAAFDDVIAAAQDANRAINEAEGYRNEVLPKARAEAAETIAQAQGYRDSVIAEATGEAARFRAVDEEYRKAPEVTRTRLYLETMESVLPGVDKVVIDPGTTGVLPYLPLDRARQGAKP